MERRLNLKSALKTLVVFILISTVFMIYKSMDCNSNCSSKERYSYSNLAKLKSLKHSTVEESSEEIASEQAKVSSTTTFSPTTTSADSITSARAISQCVTKREKTIYLKVPDPSRGCNVSDCISSKESKWKMVTFVKSAAGNTERRQLIRETWGSIKYLNGGIFETVFVIGVIDDEDVQEELDKEYEANGDILHIDELDNYSHIALKTLAAMQWASENLPDDLFYSSCDDDILVDIEKVSFTINVYKEMTKKLRWREYPIICMFRLVQDGDTKPDRQKNKKNSVSFDEYKWPVWPKACFGAMYTTSVSIIKQLYDLSRCQRIFLNTDDVWITGLLRRQLGMPDIMVVAPESRAARHILNKSTLEKRIHRTWQQTFNTFEGQQLCNC